MTLLTKLPVIHDSWGPLPNSVPEKYKDIPYAPFSKSDKVGRASDWYELDADKEQKGREGTISTHRGKRGERNAITGEGYQSFGAGVSTTFSYIHEENDASFSIVDRTSANLANSAAMKASGGFKRGVTSATWTARNARAASGSNMKVVKGTQSGKGAQGKTTNVRGGANGRFIEKTQKPKDSSITVSATWKLIEEYQLNAFNKLRSDASEPTELFCCGGLFGYDKSFDKTAGKNEKAIETNSTFKYQNNISKDPIIQKIKQTKALPNNPKNHIEGDYVFASTQVAALLMTSARSINGWDILVTKTGGVDPVKEGSGKIRTVSFEKRLKSCVDFLAVGETSAEPPVEILGDKDHINSPLSLASEAALVDQSFRDQAVIKDKKHKLGPESNEAKDCGLTYRLFDLGEGSSGSNMNLIVRGDIHGYLPTSNENKVSNIAFHALNEYFPIDPANGNLFPNYQDWRSKIDAHRGAVFATEIRNNSWKIARWTMEALLSGVEQIKLAFVSRVNPVSPSKGHVVLGTQNIFPVEFAEQTSVDIYQGWGILKSLTDIFLRLPDGRYVIYKDPNEAKVRVYFVPEEEKIPGYDQEE